MPLTDAKIRALKPVEAIKKLSDSGGLQLWLMPSGSRLCNMAYRFSRQAEEAGPWPLPGSDAATGTPAPG